MELHIVMFDCRCVFAIDCRGDEPPAGVGLTARVHPVIAGRMGSVPMCDSDGMPIAIQAETVEEAVRYASDRLRIALDDLLTGVGTWTKADPATVSEAGGSA